MVKYSNIDSIYASLSDATRRAILVKINEGKLDLQIIAKEQNISLPAVSKHLKVLEKANLIEREKVGREYKFTLKEAAKYWIDQFQKLEHFLKNS
jgi:DNA-binding transcriptional ArsR family regulator